MMLNSTQLLNFRDLNYSTVQSVQTRHSVSYLNDMVCFSRLNFKLFNMATSKHVLHHVTCSKSADLLLPGDKQKKVTRTLLRSQNSVCTFEEALFNFDRIVVK
jgi:hypothetical protein